MPLLAYGINHQSAPIAVREKLAFDPTHIPIALKDLIQQQAVNEAVILSTCNRTEIYTNLTQYLSLQDWIQQQKALKDLDLSPYCYAHHEVDAVRHLMRVASGLDSMILGEPQVFGQMKQAFQLACDTGTVGTYFNQLFPAAFSAGKDIRTQTQINTHPVSLAYAIVQLSKRIYDRLTDCRILLIGAGETIALVATHLRGAGAKQIVIANRTVEKSQHIAKPINAHGIRMTDIPIYLKETDIVISATASQLPILGKGMIESALKHKKQRPLFMVDLAVPRDIESETAKLDNVFLYNIDDLQQIITKNLKNRKQAAKQAEVMIDTQASRFLQEMRILNARGIISNYRNQLEHLRDIELQKARGNLRKGVDPQIVLEKFGHSLITKIMHQPTVKLREAAYEEQFDTLQIAKALFESE